MNQGGTTKHNALVLIVCQLWTGDFLPEKEEIMSKQTQETGGAPKWSGSFGFIMAAAGSAVGMGNLWRFPMLVGESGGGAFVLVYLICIFLVGIPLIIAEISIGRAGGKDAFGSYKP